MKCHISASVLVSLFTFAIYPSHLTMASASQLQEANTSTKSDKSDSSPSKSHLIKGELNKVFSETSEINYVVATEFKDYLYAGYSRFNNDPASGAQIWRTRDGQTWEPASVPSFGNSFEPAGMFFSTYFNTPFVFQGKLYVSFGWWYTDNETFWDAKGGQLWRTENGTEWEKVMDLADDPHNENFGNLVEFKGMLYTSTVNWFEGFELWRSPTGNPGEWTKVADDSIGTHLIGNLTPVVNGKTLFMIPQALYDQEFNQVPIHVWYTQDGLDWKPLTTDGFGDVRALAASYMVAAFRGDLYIELSMYDAAQDRSWTQVRRINKDLESEVYCDECIGLGSWIDGYFYRVSWDQGLAVTRSRNLIDWEQVPVPEVSEPGIIGANLLGKFKGEFYFQFTSSEPDKNCQIWK